MEAAVKALQHACRSTEKDEHGKAKLYRMAKKLPVAWQAKVSISSNLATDDTKHDQHATDYQCHKILTSLDITRTARIAAFLLQHWAALISMAEEPNPLSPREGKLLRLVPLEKRLTDDIIAGNLARAIASRLQADSPCLLIDLWTLGKEFAIQLWRVLKFICVTPQECPAVSAPYLLPISPIARKMVA